MSNFAFAFKVYWKSNKRLLLDAILNILGIVSISDLDDYTPIADLLMNVYPKVNFFHYELDRFYE